jgi:hypothetical protein
VLHRFQQPNGQPVSAASGSEADALAKAMNWPGLWVYHRRDGQEGIWCPPFEDLPLPPGWEFLPPGDAFVTRDIGQIPRIQKWCPPD